MTLENKVVNSDNIKPVIDMNPCVSIPVVDFKRLTRKEQILDALIAAGVENWGGYERALMLFHAEALEALK